MYIHIYFFGVVISFFAHGSIEYKWFLNRSIWPIDRKLTWISTLGQSGPGSNGNKSVLHISEISRNESSPLDSF